MEVINSSSSYQYEKKKTKQPTAVTAAALPPLAITNVSYFHLAWVLSVTDRYSRAATYVGHMMDKFNIPQLQLIVKFEPIQPISLKEYPMTRRNHTQ